MAPKFLFGLLSAFLGLNSNSDASFQHYQSRSSTTVLSRSIPSRYCFQPHISITWKSIYTAPQKSPTHTPSYALHLISPAFTRYHVLCTCPHVPPSSLLVSMNFLAITVSHHLVIPTLPWPAFVCLRRYLSHACVHTVGN